MIHAVNLGDLLDRSRPADATALIDCLDWEGPREYSFGEIDRLANACARGLLARGLGRGDAVGILAGNRAEFLIAYFGTMRAGLVSVPVNHKFPRETLEFVLRDAGATLVFCDGERRAQVPAGIPLVDFDSTAADGFEALLDPGEFAAVRPEARETAMVLYTSGSTGRLVSISQVGLPEPRGVWLGYLTSELLLPVVITLAPRATSRNAS